MAEEFQGGVCGGNWPWNSSKSLFGSSPCSLASNDVAGSLGWHRPNRFNDTKAQPVGLASDDGSSVLLQHVENSSNGTVPVDSAIFCGWNQDLLHDGGRSDESYSTALQETCQGLSSAGFPMNSTSCTFAASSLLQNLFDTDQPDQSLFDNQAMNYPNYQANSTGFLEVPPMENPMFSKQHYSTDHSPLWNNTTSATLMSDVHGNFLPSTQPLQYLPSSVNNNNKHDSSSFNNTKRQNEAARGVTSVAKKAGNEPTVKRPRIETPSPLPTFKVRKEKLGDRITALQQLVSPFGKTDTASVLHEAIEYIKFLHDQLSALCRPYLKNGSPQVPQNQPATDDWLDDQLQDLRSGGLCLVPLSSTFPMAGAATDFWNPSFGGSFKL